MYMVFRYRDLYRLVVIIQWVILMLTGSFQVMAEIDFTGISLSRDTGYSAPVIQEEQHELTLHDAVRLMLQNNPELASFSKEVRAFDGTVLQASKFRNPDFTVEVEDINQPRPSLQRFTSFRISQLIELGGKRSARMTVASLGQELADKSYESRRLDLIARAANAFIDVLAGQERLRVAEETLQLTQKVLDSATKRVESGKAPPIEETRSKVALSTAHIELEQARRDLTSARTQLSLLWGNPSPKFSKVMGDLETRVVLPGFASLEERIKDHPLVMRSLTNVEQRKAIIELEKSRRIPDVTLGGGVRHYFQSNDTTALLTMTVPIPVLDRNQGNLQEGYQRLDKAMDEKDMIHLQLRSEFTRAYEALLAAQNEVRLLHEEVLPGAETAFKVANKGYELGRFSFLEMLDAQRALFQNRVLYVRAQANYHRLINELERLVAGPIDSVMPDHESR